MKQMKIREFQGRDSEDYVKTLLLTLPCDDMNEARENVRIIIERSAQDTGELWVAEADGVGVGFMLLEFHTRNGNVEIDWLDVHPHYQQRGVGSSLVSKAVQRAREARHLTLTIHTASSNNRMREFGKKNGSVELERLPSSWGEGTEDAYLLLRRLDG